MKASGKEGEQARVVMANRVSKLHGLWSTSGLPTPTPIFQDIEKLLGRKLEDLSHQEKPAAKRQRVGDKNIEAK